MYNFSTTISSLVIRLVTEVPISHSHECIPYELIMPENYGQPRMVVDITLPLLRLAAELIQLFQEVVYVIQQRPRCVGIVILVQHLLRLIIAPPVGLHERPPVPDFRGAQVLVEQYVPNLLAHEPILMKKHPVLRISQLLHVLVDVRRYDLAESRGGHLIEEAVTREQERWVGRVGVASAQRRSRGDVARGVRVVIPLLVLG